METYLIPHIIDSLRKDLDLSCNANYSSMHLQPHLYCILSGFRIAILFSNEKNTLEKELTELNKKQSADIIFILHFSEKPEYAFKAKVLIPNNLNDVEEYIKKTVNLQETADGWFVVPEAKKLAELIKGSLSYLSEEAETKKKNEEIKQKIKNFMKAAKRIPESSKIKTKIRKKLHKFYNLKISSREDDDSIIFGQTALIILLSSVLYEKQKDIYKLPSLSNILGKGKTIKKFHRALSRLNKIMHNQMLSLTIKILRDLPEELDPQVEAIVSSAFSITKDFYLPTRDFMGRIYHEITGDIVTKKGLATYYTEIPAAYLLSNLALKTYLNMDGIEMPEKASPLMNSLYNLKISDFACGSGTMLLSLYDIILRTAENLNFLCSVNSSCSEQKEEKNINIGKKLIENGIYGFDVLKLASEITKLNLLLLANERVEKQNIFSLNIGTNPDNSISLGSLDFLVSNKITSTTQSDTESKEIPFGYDIIIMNPPFTRATGRKNKKFEQNEKMLFGFLRDKKTRETIVKSYEKIKKTTREDLIQIKDELFRAEPNINKNINGTNLPIYLTVGKSGLSVFFLYLAYRYVKPGGIIAFVLPKNLLSGTSWFLARTLLLSKFHIKYVILSDTMKGDHNFSEKTGLSECLIIAKRTDKHEENEETVFIDLLRKPKTALESIIISEHILKEKNKESGERTEPITNTTYILTRIPRKKLLENIDNWNRLIFIPHTEAIKLGSKILSGDLNVMDLHVPLTPLGNLIQVICFGSKQYHNYFILERNTITGFPTFYSGKEENREKMCVEPNAFSIPRKKNITKEKVFKWEGRILLPRKMFFPTIHYLALYSKIPVISNVFFPVKIKDPLDPLIEEKEKALVYWLNTTWGLINVIMNRDETEGTWMELQKVHWESLPVLNINKLDLDTIKRISNAFDTVCMEKIKRTSQQYSTNPSDIDPIRLKIDLEFLKAIKPNIDEKQAKEELLKIYKTFAVALNRWH
ncbi:MAG: N-6 DNA methylase [Candidatus Aenigmatarchaeota archaeon]